MANFLQKLKNGFLSLLFPDVTRCVSCGKELKTGYLCKDCVKEFYLNNSHRCEWCSRPTVSVDDVICEQCKMSGNLFEYARSPLIYKGEVLVLIRKFKYKERRDLGGFFAKYMLEEYEKLPSVDIILPVPMWKEKYRDRLYSSAEELTKKLCELVEREYRVDIVEKVRDTGTQTKLSGEERKLNVKGCFKVINSKEVKDKTILIIDDVYTTGATVNELTRVLKAKKARAVYVLTAAIAKRG